MKNTMQRYGLFRKMQALAPQKYIYARKFNNITQLIAHFCASCADLLRFSPPLHAMRHNLHAAMKNHQSSHTTPSKQQ